MHAVQQTARLQSNEQRLQWDLKSRSTLYCGSRDSLGCYKLPLHSPACSSHCPDANASCQHNYCTDTAATRVWHQSQQNALLLQCNQVCMISPQVTTALLSNYPQATSTWSAQHALGNRGSKGSGSNYPQSVFLSSDTGSNILQASGQEVCRLLQQGVGSGEHG